MNNFSLLQSSRTRMTATNNLVAMVTLSFVTCMSSGVEHIEQPIVSPESVETSNYTIFQNSQPTIQATDAVITSIGIQYDLGWIDTEIASFMDSLTSGKLPTYSEDLMNLADGIMSQYPNSFR